MVVQLGLDLSKAQKHKIEQLNELDNIRQDAVQRTSLIWQQRSRWHDQYIKERKFQAGDWALFFYSKFKDFQGNFQTHWLGPYDIEKFFNNGAVRIRTIDEEKVPLLVNGYRLKFYHKPITKEEFIKIFQDNTDMKLMKMNLSSSLNQSYFYFSYLKNNK